MTTEGIQEQERERDQNHDHNNEELQKQIERRNRSLGGCVLIFFLTISVTALTLWLVYRPRDPQFTVVSAAVSGVNMSSPTLQFTILGRNPNKEFSIYYDKLSALVLYGEEQITSEVMLEPVFHEKKSTVRMTAVLEGGGVMPVAFDKVGGVWVRVVLLGKVKWEIGSIKIGYYEVCVKCDVLMGRFNTALVDSLPCNVDFN